MEQVRIALFIDGSNLHATAKALELEIDFKRLLDEFSSRGYLVRALYYTAIHEDDAGKRQLQPLVDYLSHNGYSVISKETKEFVDPLGRRKIKGNMDIELAMDAILLAAHVDHMFIFSGDGDFCRLVQVLQQQGVRVTAVSTIQCRPPMIADELRKIVDSFIDVGDLRQELRRLPAEESRESKIESLRRRMST